MVAIKVEYIGYSPKPLFELNTLKVEYVEKETFDDAVMYLYEKANWNESLVKYNNGRFYLDFDIVDDISEYVGISYELKEEQ